MLAPLGTALLPRFKRPLSLFMLQNRDLTACPSTPTQRFSNADTAKITPLSGKVKSERRNRVPCCRKRRGTISRPFYTIRSRRICVFERMLAISRVNWSVSPTEPVRKPQQVASLGQHHVTLFNLASHDRTDACINYQPGLVVQLLLARPLGAPCTSSKKGPFFITHPPPASLKEPSPPCHRRILCPRCRPW